MIRFSKYIWLYFLLSALVLVPGMYSLIQFGLRPSLDFTGGTLLEYSTENRVSKDTIMTMAKDNGVEITEIIEGSSKNTTIRMKTTEEGTVTKFETALQENVGTSFTVLRKEIVGPVIGKELMSKAIVAALLAAFAILSYVAYAFKNIKFGISAVIALVHDVLIIFGTFSLFGHFMGVEVDALFVTAFLTTMSFSVHDTIVIFDRIREYRKRDQRMPLDELSDRALTETMGRSLVNSFTIVFMLLALVLMGGESIRWFSVALLIGTITGTYSSPFVATPILILWDRWEKRKKNL